LANPGWPPWAFLTGFGEGGPSHSTSPTSVTALYDMSADGSQVHFFSNATDHQAQGVCAGSCTSSHTMDCVVPPVTNLYLGTTNYVQASPRFRDVARGGYHLRADSPAIYSDGFELRNTAAWSRAPP
jgi:hypothetical protein